MKISLWTRAISTLLATLLATSGCSRHATTAIVVRRDINGRLILKGKVTAPATAEANVTASRQAPVGKIYVTTGQRVRKGEVLLTLSMPNAEKDYEQSRLRVHQAEKAYRRARRQYAGSLTAAKKRLEAARERERAARKAARPIPTGPDAVLDVPGDLAAELSSAIERRRQAEQEVIDRKIEMDAMLIRYRQDLDEARRRFATAEKSRRAAQLRAPISGTVLAVNAVPGRKVRHDGRPLIHIVDLISLKVLASVRGHDVGLIKPGLGASIVAHQIAGSEFIGKVQRIYAEKGRFLRRPRFVAVIDFENAKGLAKPGMDVTVTLKTGMARSVLAVPSAAVFRSGDGYAVRVLKHGQWTVRMVEIGVSDGKYTAVKSGLREGAVVRVR